MKYLIIIILGMLLLASCAPESVVEEPEEDLPEEAPVQPPAPAEPTEEEQLLQDFPDGLDEALEELDLVE